MDFGKITIELCKEDKELISNLTREIKELKMAQNQAFLIDEDTMRKFAEQIKYHIMMSANRY